MTPAAYNIAMAIGLGCVGGGTALVAGPGWALIVAGGLVIGLTLVAARMSRP